MNLPGRLARLFARPAAPAARHLLFGPSGDCRFVAENSLGVLSGESVEVRHRLELFDAEGRPVRVVEHASRRHLACIDLGQGAPELGSLIHSIQVAAERLGPEASALWRSAPEPRGVCQYRRGAGSPWATVRDGAPVRLRPEQGLWLVVLHPGTQAEEVEVLCGGRRLASLRIPPGGVRRLRLEGQDGDLELRFRRRPGRPLLFLEAPEDPPRYEVIRA